MTVASKTFTEKELVLELGPAGGDVLLGWRGRSEEREPGSFLVPILAEALDAARSEAKRLVLDFTAVEYMNSSTFTPLVKLLDEARRASVPVLFRYSLTRKWQSLSFSALRAFETSDGRVSVHGE